MAKKRQHFEHESLQDKEAIINYLKAITQGFKKGAIEFSDEDEEFRLTPQALANLKIKAEQSKKGQSLNIKISWSSDQSSDFDDSPLFIDPKKPKK
ncbi:MAG: amphi-Trp domain-containing protein [Hydrogenovibrio sp.]